MTGTMKRSAYTTVLARNPHPMALMLGLFLGQVVMVMAQRDGGGIAAFGFSAVFVVAASASFVSGVLGLRQKRAPLPAAALGSQARTLAVVIGLGLLVSLQLFG